MLFSRAKSTMPTAESALPGRPTPIPTAAEHDIFSRPLKGPYPEGLEMAMFGIGCFWGAERKFLEPRATASRITAVGYAGGITPNPTYQEVCTGRTGHNEVVLVVYDPKRLSYETLLKTFWESHDPTQGMRQGNDVGTQYRSGIYYVHRGPARRRRSVEGRVSEDAHEEWLRRRSRPRSSPRRSSTSPRTITSSTWRRSRTATAGSAARA